MTFNLAGLRHIGARLAPIGNWLIAVDEAINAPPLEPSVRRLEQRLAKLESSTRGNGPTSADDSDTCRTS